MSDRKGFYLKPGTRVTSPGSLFFVVVDALDQRDQPRPAYGITEFYRAHAIHVRYRRGQWSDLRERTFDEPLALHRWIVATADDQRRNYIIAPIASDALTLTRFWEFAGAAGIAWAPRKQNGEVKLVKPGRSTPLVFRRIVLRRKPDIVHYRHRHKTYVWLSGIQYFADGPPESIVADKLIRFPIEDTEQNSERISPDGRSLARQWCRGIVQLVDWWRREAHAPWGMTAGQLALGMLRSNIQKGDLCSHNHPETHKLERLAQHGGRASLFFAGSIGNVPAHIPPGPQPAGQDKPQTIPGPAVCLDCRSMYPALLRDEWFPVKLIGTSAARPAAEPQALARSVGVIAHVAIRTDWPEFPRRGKEVTTYPTGTFNTTLTGPELLALDGRGEVLACHQLAIYQLGQPFKAAAQKLLDLRAQAEGRGDKAGALFAKLTANSLGGKLAQKPGSWAERRHQAPEVEWGEFHVTAKDGKHLRRFRSIGGLVWEWLKDHNSAGPFGAAFAYLTAHGRLRMARLREKCPPRSVYAQDTDGVWCHPSVPRHLKRRGEQFGDRPGEIRLQETAQWARFWGPRHYATDLGWTLSGFCQPEPPGADLTIIDTQNVNPVNWSPHEPPHTLTRRKRESKLEAEIHGGKIEPSGWITPTHWRTLYTSG